MDPRAILATLARRYLGRPYRYGAKPLQTRSFDCSSLVQYLYHRLGVELPRVSIDQAAHGRTVRYPRQQLRTGDLLFFRGSWGRYNPSFPKGIGHVAMFVEPGWVVHAYSDAGKVVRQRAERWLRRQDRTVVKRLLP